MTLLQTFNSLTPGIGIELGSSKTDDILFPTSGSFLFFTPELFHSRSDIKFVLRQISDQIIQADTNLVGSIYFYRFQTGVSNYLSLSYDQNFSICFKIKNWLFTTYYRIQQSKYTSRKFNSAKQNILCWRQ